jgi:anti-repressor protein
MNQLLETRNQTPIEIALGIDEEGRTTAKKLYEFLELNPANYSRWCKSNITDNQFAEESVDYWAFIIQEERNFNPNPTTDYKLTADFAKKLSMMQKNDRGEQARDYFSKVDTKMKEVAIQFNDMSPQLQFMIKMEAEQKRQAKELAEVKEQSQKAIEKADAIQNTIIAKYDNWRDEINHLINQIQAKSGVTYADLRTEIYGHLTYRAGCDLNARVRNLKARLTEEGATKTVINGTNKMTIIESDKKLKEIFTQIVKEYAVKFLD